MPALQIDWYWAVIGMLSAYVLGTAHAQNKLKKFADTVVQRTVTSLRPAPPPMPAPAPRRRRITEDRERAREQLDEDSDDNSEG